MRFTFRTRPFMPHIWPCKRRVRPLVYAFSAPELIESMRMEKGFLHWKADLITEYDPFETGLDRFVKLDKGEFVGRAGPCKPDIAAGSRRRLVTLKIDAKHRPAHPGSSVMDGNKVVGTVTSGDWGHRTGLNLAYAFIDTAFAAEGSCMEIDLCGERTVATVIPPSPYDPAMSRVRS